MDFSFDLLKKNLHKLEDRFFGKIHEKLEPAQKLISYYRRALMEVETKFRGLNEELRMKTIWDSIENKSMQG
ncbi:MAG: hypothetical protein LBL70_07665 [Treponema sp.]|nr:hypothetical protein [Treponema sp.]